MQYINNSVTMNGQSSIKCMHTVFFLVQKTKLFSWGFFNNKQKMNRKLTAEIQKASENGWLYFVVAGVILVLFLLCFDFVV